MAGGILNVKVMAKCENPDCGKEFLKEGTGQRYCSAECKKHAAYLRSKEYKYQEGKFCAYCGKKFYSVKAAKYCGVDCRLMANGRKKPKRIRGRGDKPSMSLSEAARVAREEGLSYGQYFNKHGYGDYFDR